MTQKDRDILIELKTLVMEMHKELKGNGQPGMLKRFDKVESRQINCMEARAESEKKRRFDVKWAIIGILGLIDAWSVYKGYK